MKPKLLHAFLPVVSLLCLSSAFSQQKKAFAITGETKGSYNWTVVREIDLSTGAVLRNIYVPSTDKLPAYDALTGKKINDEYLRTAPIAAGSPETVLTGMIAAAAYDARYNRLFYTPMQSAELRYIDLNGDQPKVYCVKHQALKQFVSHAGEEDVITRMTFAADGYGYAITNNGNHLIRFSTGQKVMIEDLGSLVDGKDNKENSIHAQCASWGGDMVGDAFGNLYVVSVKGHLFKINPNKRTADYQGTISKLPADYSVNGVVVDDDNSIVVSSAVNTASYYRVNLTTLEATALPKDEDKVYNASDLANGALAFSNMVTPRKNVFNPEVKGNRFVTIYPNPVRNKAITVVFNGNIKGKHDIALVDMQGRNLLVRNVNVAGKQTERINLPANFRSGMYLLKITGDSGSKVYADKMVVED